MTWILRPIPRLKRSSAPTEAEVPRVLPTGTRALYVGGLALRLAPGATVLEELMRRTRRQGPRAGLLRSQRADWIRLLGRGRARPGGRQLAFPHVIKASEDDTALLYPGRDYREIAAAWQECGGRPELGISAEVLRGLLARASVSAALTCERGGAQSRRSHPGHGHG